MNATSSPCIPPLDADFFTQLQRVENSKHRALIRDVMADVVSIFGVNFEVSMETVFATLEHTIRMLKTTGDNRDFKRTQLEAIRTRLLQAIAVVLEASLCGPGSTGGSARIGSECANHSTLVEKAMRGRDDIISFNYDCVIDQALKKKGNGKWNSRYGYGVDLGPGGKKLIGDQYWQPDVPSKQNQTIHLYKLHGSLHFQVQETKAALQLKQRPYTKQKGNLRFSIIAPESNKAYDRGIFAGLWKQAAGAVKRARQMVIIGYSLPNTDLHSTALLRTSVAKEKLESLVVVNPDPDARRRARNVLQRGLKTDTQVLSFGRLDEFLAADISIWR